MKSAALRFPSDAAFPIAMAAFSGTFPLLMKHETRFSWTAAAVLVAFAALLGACKTNDSATESPTVQPSDPNSLAGSSSTPPSSYPNPTGAPTPPATPGATDGAGWKTTYSGLKYLVLREGTGQRPTMYNRVKVHYHGTLPDGTVFDSSVQRGQPATFGLNQVIEGWREGIPLMREGAKYRFIVPPNLAYGPRGMPPKIGPNQTLIFDVELFQVVY